MARTGNRKTGDVPTAYIGTTVDEAWKSCEGCELRAKTCYAWGGLARPAMHRHERRYRERPEFYQLDDVLTRIAKDAKFARIGAMGDPARADRDQLWSDVEKLKARGLGIISYTHFWRDDYAQDLRDLCLASCDNTEEAEEAANMGWRPSVVLPWDHYTSSGARFYMQTEQEELAGVVCPAQTKDAVTCNDCLLCDLTHKIWDADKVHGIGFLNHSRAARAEARRYGGRALQLPLFKPKKRLAKKERPASDYPTRCQVCDSPLPQYPGHGRPRVNCSVACRVRAADRRKKNLPVADADQGASP